MTEGFLWDAGTPQERCATPAETRQLLVEMERVLTHDCAHLIYRHKVGYSCPVVRRIVRRPPPLLKLAARVTVNRLWN